MKSIKPSQSYINQDRAASLLKKWAPLLEHSDASTPEIKDDHTKLNTAILLENQEQWCLGEASNTAGTGGSFGTAGSMGFGGKPSGDFYATGDARLPKILIPMIRRTFPELITNEIVGVQPMSGPVGLAFALRYRYEASPLGGQGIDNGYPAGAGTNSIQGWTAQSNTPGNNSSPAANTETGWNYLNTAYTGTSASWLSGGATAITGSEAFQIAGLTNGSADNGVAAALASFELTSNIPQMVVAFEKTAVEAGTRRLAARWSVELEQDLKNMNGIDVDNELTNAMSYEIQAEIDREMIIRMCQVAINAGYGQGYSVWSPLSADGRWLGERNRDFYARVIVEANRVAIRNRRGAANFIVGTPRVCAMLEMLPEFQWYSIQGNVNTQPVGIAKVGTVGGRFNVYRDTRTEAQYQVGSRTNPLEYALLGYKGAEYYDTGIVYCPYIPVLVQRTIGPNDFSPRVGLMTRYGVIDHIFGAALYYHLIIVTGLHTSFVPGTQSVFL
jgi:Major capsid protein Gp23